jgi:hypothetical protein
MLSFFARSIDKGQMAFVALRAFHAATSEDR